MYNFILQTIVMVSLGVIIYLMARALPRVTDTTPVTPQRDYIGELLKRFPLEKADSLFTNILGKLLRKAKIVILKFDNVLSKHLHSLKEQHSSDTISKDRPDIFNSAAKSTIEKNNDTDQV
ncbi:MAG: hypothetical protein Q8R26_03030 [bacterium]|nr:hypothetical protein [bacterium]